MTGCEPRLAAVMPSSRRPVQFLTRSAQIALSLTPVHRNFSETMTNVDTLLPELQLPPRYQVRSVLKETPATAVYRVYDASFKRDVAIKILRHELSEPQQMLRFRAEFSTLVSLDHPSIIKVHDFGLLQDRFPYFTMEFFSGKKISEYFDGHSWDALYDVILQIAAGLHHIHHQGIIHLDLKPSNILVDDRGKAKIMDFGLAIESHQVLDRQIRGTLHYMAPEVLRQDRVDSRADLYALGMTLYETVTGALPGYGKPPIDVIRMRLDEDIRPPSAINPRVPEELEQIIMRLLEKDPRHRYTSAAALLHDIAEVAGKTAPAGELLVGKGELYAAPLIGRKHEVSQLMSLIAEAREGRGCGAIVAGAEGMGKSRIVRDATLRAQLDGARVFCGRCPSTRARTATATRCSRSGSSARVTRTSRCCASTRSPSRSFASTCSRFSANRTCPRSSCDGCCGSRRDRR